MPLPPIPTQAADQVNISRQPKPELKKRPKRVEIEETNPVEEATAPETLESTEIQTTPQFLAQSAIERMKAPAKGAKKAAMATRQSPKVRKTPDRKSTRLNSSH